MVVFNNMLNKMNIEMRTGYKVHMIILGKKCNCFTICAVINISAYLTQINRSKQHVFIMTFK